MVKKVITVIELLLILLIIFCAVFLGRYFYSSHKSQTEINELKKKITEEIDYSKYRNGMFDAYSTLYNDNNDFSGWVKIPGTSIDYPVMQHSDNDYYIHRNFRGEYQYSGLPFADSQCDLVNPGSNTVIYAHNMKDGTMFAPLLKYKDRSFYDTHKEIIFNTLYDAGEYEIIAAFCTSPSEFQYHSFINAKSKREFDEFIAHAKRISFYDTGETADFSDKLLTLSTCAYDNNGERFAVVAKLIK